MNGKGSKPRTFSTKKYIENYDAIDWDGYPDKSYNQIMQDEAQRKLEESEEFISDGFGSHWPKECPCCKESLEIVRPGKVQCPNCD